MSILIHTQTKNDFTSVYLGDCCFRGHFFGKSCVGFFFLFFVYAHGLGKVGCQLYAMSCGKRLIEIVVYQVYARKYGKWFIEFESYQVYALNFGFFCSLEKIEDDGLTVKTH